MPGHLACLIFGAFDSTSDNFEESPADRDFR